ANACRTVEVKLIVWTLLDTGLRVSELRSLTLDNLRGSNGRLAARARGPPWHAEQATGRPVVGTGPRAPGTALCPEPPMVRRDAPGPEDRQTGRPPRQARQGGHPVRAPPYMGDAGAPGRLMGHYHPPARLPFVTDSSMQAIAPPLGRTPIGVWTARVGSADAHTHPYSGGGE